MLKESPEGHWRICWPIALALTVAYCSSRAVPEPFATMMFKWDKVVHFCVFGLIGTLLARLRWVQHRAPLGAYAAVLLVALFGATDEIHQSFTPGRCCDFSDWLADTLGAATFVVLYVRSTAYRTFLEQKVVVRSGERVTIELPRVPVPRLA
jgi:VanZ family protein